MEIIELLKIKIRLLIVVAFLLSSCSEYKDIKGATWSGSSDFMEISSDKMKMHYGTSIPSNKVFIGGLMMVILWSFFSLRGKAKSEEDKKSREATKSAIIALVIAIMSELHLSIAPFWLVWIAAYYLDAH